MNNQISKNYLLNRYNYLLYFVLLLILILKTVKENNQSINVETVIIFSSITLIFLIYNFIYNSFCFFDQVKVSRIDYNSVLIQKGFSQTTINKGDLKEIIFTVIVYVRGNPFYKITMVDNKGEKYRFITTIKIFNIEKYYKTDEFLKNTENCWGLIDNKTQIICKNTC